MIALSVPASQLGRHFDRSRLEPLKSSRKISLGAGGVVGGVVGGGVVGGGVVDGGVVDGGVVGGGGGSVMTAAELTDSTGRFSASTDSDVATLTWDRTPFSGARRLSRSRSVRVPGLAIECRIGDTSNATRPSTGVIVATRVADRRAADLVAIGPLAYASTVSLSVPRFAARCTRTETFADPPSFIAASAFDETANGRKRRRSLPSRGCSPTDSDRLWAP